MTWNEFDVFLVVSCVQAVFVLSLGLSKRFISPLPTFTPHFDCFPGPTLGPMCIRLLNQVQKHAASCLSSQREHIANIWSQWIVASLMKRDFVQLFLDSAFYISSSLEAVLSRLTVHR